MSEAIVRLMRPDLLDTRAYEAAEPDFSRLRLHANESPWAALDDAGADGSMAGLNRYPPVRALALEQRLAALYGLPRERLIATRGSDDGIDLLLRAFCRAGIDQIIVQPPCFGMYESFARVQGARVIAVPLRAAEGFRLRPQRVIDACDDQTRLIFLCSPNNPTGNLHAQEEILEVCAALRGHAMVVVDEAYIEYARSPGDGAQTEAASLTARLDTNDNLIVLRTLSKAWGLAGLRCGAVLAHPLVIGLLQAIATPYALPEPVIDILMNALSSQAPGQIAARLEVIRRERALLREALAAVPGVRTAWPSDANFLLVEMDDPDAAVRRCRDRGVLIRRFAREPALRQAVRITVGSPAQNAQLLACLQGEPA